MAFMQPQITDKARWLAGEAKDGGTYYAPDDQFSVVQFVHDVLGYGVDEGAVAVQRITGWGVRLSAPGYLDCTDWEVFEDRDEALIRYKELRDEGPDEEEPYYGGEPEDEEPEGPFVVTAKVFHHENMVGTLVATIEFDGDLIWGGEAAVEDAVLYTTSHNGNWWDQAWIKFTGHEGQRRDTRAGDRILIEFNDGSNDIFTVEATDPLRLYHGAK